MIENLEILDNYYSAIQGKVGLEGREKKIPSQPDNTETPEGNVAKNFNVEKGGRTPYGRDPFRLTNRILSYTGNNPAGLRFIPGFAKGVGSVRIPVMRMKGLIKVKGKDLAALVEVSGDRVYVVRVDDTIGLYENGKNTVVKVRAINDLSVVVEVGTLGQVIIVR
ncbi:MAG: hypothetical protein JKY91_01415 [Emcibacter sp.]|nr:hypothetical protein [Emcibacter sp.]MBL4894968.1 hypothetical protein [Emcibacter sp.]